MTELITNENIENREMLVIGEDGTKIGIMKKEDALQRAYENDLDLVLMSVNNNIAICKIFNYGKYKYEMLKKEKESKKKQHTLETSEIQIGLYTQRHDLETKMNAIKRLISKGNDVRIVLRLNGREVTRIPEAIEKVNELISMCSDFAKVKKEPYNEGRDIRALIEKM